MSDQLNSGAGPSGLLNTKRGLKMWTEFATNMAIAPNSTAVTVASEINAEYQKGGCAVVGRRAALDRSFLHLR